MEQKQLTLRQRLDALASQGKEIKVYWEGGNDDGGFTVHIDGDALEWGDEFGTLIIDVIENTIDYGSWAGDYYADGSVVYDSNEGAFIGEGKETQTDYASVDDANIEIKVPKELNFDSLSISSEGDDRGLSLRVHLDIQNGPVFLEHSEFETQLESSLNTNIYDAVCEYCDNSGMEVCSISNEWIINFNEFKDDGKFLVYTIESIDFSNNEHTYHNHHIEINDEE